MSSYFTLFIKNDCDNWITEAYGSTTDRLRELIREENLSSRFWMIENQDGYCVMQGGSL